MAQANNEPSRNYQNEIALPTDPFSAPVMPVANSSTQTEPEPALFKFNPMTDPFHPDSIDNQGSSSTKDDSYFFDQNPVFDIPLIADSQCISQDFNFELATNINHDVSMDYTPITEPMIPAPTMESLELSIQILWAEHQMTTRYLEGRLAETIAASDSLRKDVDAMAEWIQRIYDHLDSSLAPSASTENGSQERVE